MASLGRSCLRWAVLEAACAADAGRDPAASFGVRRSRPIPARWAFTGGGRPCSPPLPAAWQPHPTRLVPPARSAPSLSPLLPRSPRFCSFPSPQLLLGVEIAFQLPFAFPINPDSAIKSAGGAGREAAAGTGPLGAVASAPLPFRPRLLPAPPCAAGRPGRGAGTLWLLPSRSTGWGRSPGRQAGERWAGRGPRANLPAAPLGEPWALRPHPQLTSLITTPAAYLPVPRGGQVMKVEKGFPPRRGSVCL